MRLTSVLPLLSSLLLLAGAVTPGYAAHPLISDDAGTLGTGAVQIELNSEFGGDRDTSGVQTATTRQAQVAATLGYGIGEKLDVNLGFGRPWSSVETGGRRFRDAGSVDLSLNLKWQLFEHEGLSVALKPQLGFSRAVGVPEHDYTMSYGAALVCTKEFEPFALHLNLGYTYNDYRLAAVRAATRNDIVSISLAGTYEVIKGLRLVADVGGATNADKAVSEIPLFGLGGAIYALNKNIDLSGGVKVGLSIPETDVTGLFGITLKF